MNETGRSGFGGKSILASAIILVAMVVGVWAVSGLKNRDGDVSRSVPVARGSSFDTPATPSAVPSGADSTPAAPESPQAGHPDAVSKATSKSTPVVADDKSDIEDTKPVELRFSTLVFRYLPRAKGGGDKDQYPSQARALNGRKVTIDGYMMPLEGEQRKVKVGLLARSTFGCCYADSPQMSEIIKVVAADGKPYAFYSMSRVTGTLEVGEEFDKDGYISSLYRLRADAIVETPYGR